MSYFGESQNLQDTCVTCGIFVLAPTIMMSILSWNFPSKCTQYHYAHGGGGGGGGVGACYTECGAFQELYHILEYKNRIQHKVSFLSKYL